MRYDDHPERHRHRQTHDAAPHRAAFFLPSAAPEGPLTPAELELVGLDQRIMKPNGKFEPQDVDYDYMVELLAAARRQSGRIITNLDELAAIGRKHGQLVDRKPPVSELRPPEAQQDTAAGDPR